MAIDLGVCKKSNYLNIIIVLLYIAISLSGCVTLNDPEVSQEYNTDPVGLIDSQSTIGQTFISQRARLNGVTLWLSLPNQNSNVPNQVGPIPILFQLFNNLSDDQPVFTSTIYPTASTSSTPISIKIPNNNNPSGQSFYLELSTNTGSIQVNGRSEDAYPSGTAYRNRSEIDADLAFRVSYDYDFMAFLQDLGHWSRNIFLLFPLAIVLWLPGWLLLDFSGIHNKFGNIESLGLSIGLSVAIIPLVILWTTTLHLSWTRESILIISIILVTIFIGRLAYKFRGKKLELRKNDEPGSSNILEHHDHRSASFFLSR
jgi:hypothetical protein